MCPKKKRTQQAEASGARPFTIYELFFELRVTNYELRFGKFARRWRGLCNAQASVVGKITGECYEESGGGKAASAAHVRITNYELFFELRITNYD